MRKHTVCLRVSGTQQKLQLGEKKGKFRFKKKKLKKNI